MIENIKTYLTITLVDIDSADMNESYYLYEIKSQNMHYYITRSSNDKVECNTENYKNHYDMYERKDFTDKEWQIAKTLFMFLWESQNGCNTCMDYEQLEEESISKDEIETFCEKFGFEKMGVLDVYEEDGIEIYWDYFSCFDLTTCNFWEEQK